MRVLNAILVAPLLLAISTSVLADSFTNEDAWQAMLGSAGHWQGQIKYANSNPQIVDLRLNTEMTPDQKTLIRYLTYADDGERIYAVSLLTQSQDSGSLVESYFRNGNGSLHSYQVTNVEFNDPSHWQISYQRRSDDGNNLVKLGWQRQSNKMESKEWRCQPGGSQCQLVRETRLKYQQGE